MKKMFVTALALCLYHANAHASAPLSTIAVPAECKNLALMQAQLLTTQFHNNEMGGGSYNPVELKLKAGSDLKIGKVEYLGGDSEDENTHATYPCEQDATLCSHPADAGGAIDWARLTIESNDRNAFKVAEVVVSMGSRGGCTISSSKFSNQ